MTTAAAEGRRLSLTVEGVDESFLVDPLPARRGQALTEEFLQASLGTRTTAQTEQIFIETFGPSNYSRASGAYVDEFDLTSGEWLRVFGPTGEISLEPAAAMEPGSAVRYASREGVGPDVDAIRQEEIESLCLLAFYWQTVVGMEAVQAYIEAGEGTLGSLKALSLLTTRLGISQSRNSSSRVLESSIHEEAHSVEISGTATAFGTVHLPADHRPPSSKRRPARNRRS